MPLVRCLAGGMVGGMLGAIVWAAIGYAGYELCILAWGIGFVVGLGTRIGAQEWDGAVPGVVAVGVAILSICIGKYAAV